MLSRGVSVWKPTEGLGRVTWAVRLPQKTGCAYYRWGHGSLSTNEIIYVHRLRIIGWLVCGYGANSMELNRMQSSGVRTVLRCYLLDHARCWN